jgi:hypothetical protein
MRLSIHTTGLRVLLLAATLIVGQWLLAQHLAQVEAHAAGDSCEWCLTHTPLAGALPGAAPALPPLASHVPSPVDRIAFLATGFRPAYSPRAPPHASVV